MFKKYILYLIPLFLLVAKGVCAQTVRVGIEQEQFFTTARIQPVVGKWRLELHKKLATGTQIIDEELGAEEDAVLMLIPKGIILRVSSEFTHNQGFDKVIVKGGELLSLELPGLTPKLLNGKLEITHDEYRITIVNTLLLDNLIVSCASNEVISCESEAVKAHTIAVATKINYLIKNTKHPDEPFELCDSKHCIEFKGSGINRDLVGILYAGLSKHLIFYKNKLIYPRYHHTCGGRISSAKDVYGIANEPYHIARKDLFEDKGSENCFHSPSFHWILETPTTQMKDFLTLEFAGGADNIFTTCEPLKVSEEGRILMLRLKGRKIKEIHGLEFLQHLHSFFGLNSFKSLRYTVEPKKRTVIIKGMGQGEGVGMCLYGADGLAKKGQNYRQILEFYYPGTTLR